MIGSLFPSLGSGPMLFVVKIPISGISFAIFSSVDTSVVTSPAGMVKGPLIFLLKIYIFPIVSNLSSTKFHKFVKPRLEILYSNEFTNYFEPKISNGVK